MALKIDPAIIKALSLDISTTSIASYGGSKFASTFKIASKTENGEERLYFLKIVKGKASEVMFAGEHMSLNAIHSAVPSLCPRSYANGKLSDNSGSFLATDFLDLSASSHSSHSGSGMSLAEKIAKLHCTPVPIPHGYDTPQFGFPVPTSCGDTQQDNSFKSSWADFYANNRLRHVLSCAERNNGSDPELASLVEQIASIVVPRLLRDGHLTSPDGSPIPPAVVHGDLWSGNHGRGRIGDGPVEDVVFDASASWSHAEYEFGIMRIFGGLGLGTAFEREYEEFKAKDSPVEEWDDRVELYELYHHLNHYSIFGGGYKGGAVSLMRKLLEKYGKESV